MWTEISREMIGRTEDKADYGFYQKYGRKSPMGSFLEKMGQISGFDSGTFMVLI